MSIPDLDFKVESAEPLPFAASPHIVFKLHVTNRAPVNIHTAIVRCQVQLETARRAYEAGERGRLKDLFGEPAQWGETLRSLLWTNTSVILPSFSETVTVDLQVPCSFDFNAAATKYFAGLQNGVAPVGIYFSGTVFYADENGALQAGQISWDKEALYRMPVEVWRNMMDLYYPNTAWLCLERGAFQQLNEFKIQRGLTTFEQAIAEALGRDALADASRAH